MVVCPWGEGPGDDATKKQSCEEVGLTKEGRHHCFLGVSICWNGIWNGTMEWMIKILASSEGQARLQECIRKGDLLLCSADIARVLTSPQKVSF